MNKVYKTITLDIEVNKKLKKICEINNINLSKLINIILKGVLSDDKKVFEYSEIRRFKLME